MGANSKKGDYDFAGYVTKNNIKCKDGRVIRNGAFAHCSGKTVPLVWNHMHGSASDVAGHVLLEDIPGKGTYGYAKTNNTETGKLVKELVHSGDITAFSIYAGHVKQKNSDVMHGDIQEVSVVLAGANPEATIDTFFEHGDGEEEEMLFFMPDDGACEIIEDGFGHADDGDEEDNSSKEEGKKVEEKKDDKKEDKKEKTLKEAFDEMPKEYQEVAAALVGLALEDAKGGSKDDDDEEENGGNKTVKHNAFENHDDDQITEDGILSQSDMEEIIRSAKSSKASSLKDVYESYCFAHSLDTTGMEGPSQSTASQRYGVRDLSMLVSDYHNTSVRPEFIGRDTDWVSVVMAGVHKTPYKRIRSIFADITEDEARAKGYIKGNQKTEEVFTLLKRTTDPQTIYKKQKVDRDDILDIDDFDVVAWIKDEMGVMLDEEKARAILIGDGRSAASNDKIKEDHIRPIASDVPLFNIKADVTVAAKVSEEDKAKAFIKAVKRARKQYKGSGNPTCFTTEDVLTECLMLEDTIGHTLYKSVDELATALRVSRIVTVEPMVGATVDSKPVMAVIVNLKDYNVGGDTGRDQGLFDDFDIDMNQYKYLRETRMSGALTKPFSAMTILLNQASGNAG